MTKRAAVEDTADVQIAASEPEGSAFVAANAGSGKTHVLVQKVIRLLLRGVEPARILCITFTKAAAANMATRVFDTLASWTALDDRALDDELRKLGVRAIDDEVRTGARRLFALALETPGGLKVQTIHAFCTHLLHLFPFEAGVAARFIVLDEAQALQLLNRICLSVLLAAAADPQSERGRALATAIAAAADRTFREMLEETIAARDKVKAWIDRAGGLEGAVDQLSSALGIAADDSLARLEQDLMASPNLPMSLWSSVADRCAASSSRDQAQCVRLRAAAAATGEARIDAYLSVFFTDKNEPRSAIVTGPFAKKHPEIASRLDAEQGRAMELRHRYLAIAARDRTAALLTIAAEVIERYQAEKDRRGLLDYEDLIDKALDLLTSVRASWVHYKLDQGIDHVLIDEAQDTSPKQWDVIDRLVAEFFAGSGARDSVVRTIFAVGDEKQSIFSFQGAAPHRFDEMRRHFEAAHRSSGRKFASIRFLRSFRAGSTLLGSVDKVFSHAEAFSGLTVIPEPTVHQSVYADAPGLVEVWEPFRPDETRSIEAWDAPFDTATPRSPQVRLARKIARTVAAWQRQGSSPGDVLILVRRRGALFDSIIRALKNEGIAVAGADRLVLTEHIAVMDLIVLADAILLPDDDLALATVLKSPLFCFDEERLFDLAYKREGTLRAALRAASDRDPRFAEASARLDELTVAAAQETPFAFYARVLNTLTGRSRILARLGHEAADPIDEFLNLAFDYERNETPSLQGFVAWLRAAKTQVKRDMEIKRDEVRVMTVHGAKGLEARAVILADTTTPPQGFHPPRLLVLDAATSVPGSPERLVWANRAAADVGPMEAAREAARLSATHEYHRLLYVAMTRAAERLVVCGAEGKRGRPAGCWYDLVFDALKEDLVEQPADDGEGTVLRFCKTPLDARKSKAETPESKAINLPSWLTEDAPPDPPRLKIVSPSSAFDEAASVPGKTPRGDAEHRALRNKALQRGNLFHRLMQSLPDVAVEHRADVARRFLAHARDYPSVSPPERDVMMSQVVAILQDQSFAALFGPGSRAEAPIVGKLDEGLVSGQVDRLAVTPAAVLIADYKTNRPAPRDLADAIRLYPAYVTQLSLYRAVLQQLYPDRAVRAALVWTEVPQLMEIPASALDAALAAQLRNRKP